MKMNKKGQLSGLAFSILVALVIYMIGMTTVNILTPMIDQSRIDLSCSNYTNITDASKMTCLMTDATVPYFMVLIFAVAGGLITEKLLI